jgi:site-specific DNA-methyltransferase (adenine-specific)
VHGEALATMRQMPDGCVHLILVDPPYFRVKGEAWDRQWDTAAGFLAWMGELADEWRRVLAPNGSIYVFASPQMGWGVEGVIRGRFDVLTNIRWVKEGRSRGACKDDLRAYFPDSETIIFAEHRGADSMAMGESGYAAQCETLRGHVFEPLRAYLADEWARAGLTPRDLNEATGSQMAGHYLTTVQWALPTAEKYSQMQARANRDGDGHLRREYEDLRREYEDLRREYEDLRREYEDLRRPFTVSADVPYTDVWTYPTVAKYPGKHPCEKPREMIADMIRASSRPGDHVLDCFLGSGVTGEQAANLGRRFTGVEMGDYVHAARRRIANAIGSPEAAAHANETAPRGAQLGLL